MEETKQQRLRRINNARTATRNNTATPPTDEMVLNQITRNPEMVLNAMTSRADLLTKLFDPRRDIDDECGYPKIISQEQYRRQYDRGLGQRVVDVYPSETWKEFPTIYEDPDPATNTPFEEGLEVLDKRLHLLHYLQRADELSGVGHYGLILWGLDDGKQLNEPVDGHEAWEEATGTPGTPTPGTERRIIFIRVFDESLVQIAAYETDVTSARYGLPTFYNVTLTDPRRQEGSAITTPADATLTSVHWSRVTHIVDNRKTSEVLGAPRQEASWDRLMDLRKVLSGSGEMFWRGGFPGVSLETQPGLEGAEFDEEATARMMFDYMNGLQRYIALTGMSAKSLAPQIADPSASFKVQIQAICVIIGVPYRVFMGIEEGVVSGDQATKAWEGRLANRQARYVTPMIIDPVLQRLISYSALPPTAEPMGWTVEWPDQTQPGALEEAEVCNKKTEALAKYVGGGVDALIPPMEFLTLFCGLDDDTAESILAAAVEHIEEIADDDATPPGRVPAPPELEEAPVVDGGVPAKKKAAAGTKAEAKKKEEK